MEIADEVLEEAKKADPHFQDVRFYYRFQRGHPVINVNEKVVSTTVPLQYTQRKLKRESIDPQQSILSRRKDPNPEPRTPNPDP